MKITLELTREEWAWLKALSIRYGVSATEILQGFAADLTGSNRSNGSDERDRAESWLRRRYSDRLAQHNAYNPLSEGEDTRMYHYQSRAYLAREQERAEWERRRKQQKEGAEQ